MSFFQGLTYKNLKGRPQRSILMIVLSLIMSVVLIAGTLMVSGLRKGIDAAEARLGADIMVVPYEASTKSSLSEFALQGNSGQYYMPKSTINTVKKAEGIKEISAQYILATIAASCCSTKVKIMAFEPETDFTIQPWIETGYSKDLGDLEIIAGSNIVLDVGDTFKAYSVDLKVVAKMAATGSYLDSSVYATFDTVEQIYTTAIENGNTAIKANPSPASNITSILVNVAEGYSVDTVVGNIKIAASSKGVATIKSSDMLSEVGKSLSGISTIIGVLVGIIWALSFIIMVVTYLMMINERKKEFAILRVVGGSKGKLSKIVFKESLTICISGGILGTALGTIIILLFKNAISQSINLPFSLPDALFFILFIIGSILFSAIAGVLASLFATGKINKIDPAITLREDN